MSVNQKKSSKPVAQPQVAFFETTPLKLVILSICTGGLYQIYWFYKMWRCLYPKAGKLGAVTRALMCRLFLYELLKNQQVPYAIVLAITFFVLGFAAWLPGVWSAIIPYITVVPLVYVQLQLNKRLKKPVKAPFTKRSVAVAVVGVICTVLFFILATHFNAKMEQSNASATPAAHQKVAKETSPKDQDASQVTTQDQSSASPTNTSTATNNTTAKPAATTPPTKSTKSSSASTPTTYPTADPAKIKQYAAPFDPYPNNSQITSASVSLNSTCGSTGYYYDLHFLEKAKAGTFAAHWEVVTGIGSVPTFPQLSLSSGVIRIYDTLQYGFTAAAAPYTVRLHVTSPNDIYSNAVTIVSCS